MRRLFLTFFAVLVAAAATPLFADPPARAITTYHGDLLRSGRYALPRLTWETARGLHLDPSFHAEFTGHVHAQPLYWTPKGSPHPLLILATEENVVYALDAESGHLIWKRELGPPVQAAGLACGDIAPLGVTSAPAIDAARDMLYVSAAVSRPEGLRHFVYALSLKDGSVAPGWPVNMTEALAGQEPTFHARVQNQRGALAIVGDMVYVPFGSFFDCGTYHGQVIGLPLADPHKVKRWVARAQGGSVWAPGGVVSDGKSLFIATGNTKDAKDWADGEAVIRLPLDLRHSGDPRDFFAPSDWRDLDAKDSDLGGIAPMLIDLPSATGVKKRVLAVGKDGKAYLLDRDNLGGIGGALAVLKVSTHGVYASAASYPLGNAVNVAFPTEGVGCPNAVENRGLIVVAVRDGAQPALDFAWCGKMQGLGAPIVTTTDGHSDPIVWAVGAQGDNRLHGFRGDNGEVLFDGPPKGLPGVHRLQTLIAAGDHLYVAADDTVYAFSF